MRANSTSIESTSYLRLRTRGGPSRLQRHVASPAAKRQKKTHRTFEIRVHSPLPSASPEQKYTFPNCVPSGYSQSACSPPVPAATAAASAAAAVATAAPEERGANRTPPFRPLPLPLPLSLPLPAPPSPTKGCHARGAWWSSTLRVAQPSLDDDNDDDGEAKAAPPPCWCWCC